MSKYKKRFGDRYDGRLLRKIDPFFKLIPYIMRTRSDSQVFFDDKIDMDRVEEFLKEKRRAGTRDIKFLHIIIAAMVRTLSQKPHLNRFIAGQKIYARDEILISIAIKKQLSDEGEETTLKLNFEPADTLKHIVSKVNSALEENKKSDVKNDTDKTARIFTMCPGFFIKFLIWILTKLDYFGLMPKIINKVSPFHTSVFITDLGSLGIQPVYHHIYDFGTTSIFMAFGSKQKEKAFNIDNIIIERKLVNLKVVADERIVDGYYYASAFKLFKKLIENPEKLETAPDRLFKDTAVYE